MEIAAVLLFGLFGPTVAVAREPPTKRGAHVKREHLLKVNPRSCGKRNRDAHPISALASWARRSARV
jgi:hypothetical protein